MMVNLFSSFDPTTLIFSFNWISMMIGSLFIPPMYWSIPSRWTYIWAKMIILLHIEFKNLLTSKPCGSTLIFISLFSMILFNNFISLGPYIFTSSSHLAMSLSLSLPLWMSFMLYGWVNHTSHMFAHLIPQGTPKILMPFMVLIETISNLIRPGTLSIRLTANMIAGHLLLILLGNSGPSLNFFMINALIFVQIILLLLESAVAVIQSYVFAVLSNLYSSEID